MNIDDVHTVKQMQDYIKWSIKTAGTLFDGWSMTEDEIKQTAEAIFNLANAGGMEINVKLDECKYRIWRF